MPGSPRSDIQLAELLSLPGVRLGHYESLLVMVWRGVITFDCIERAAMVQENLAMRFSRLTGLAVVTEGCAAPADASLVGAATLGARKLAANARGTAVVIRAHGSAASTARVAVQGLLICSATLVASSSWRLPSGLCLVLEAARIGCASESP